MQTTGQNEESIYGDAYPALKSALEELLSELQVVREELTQKLGMDPVEHYLGRIKSEESMREKCVRKGLPQTPQSALEEIHDAIGVRVVCPFIDDVYALRDAISRFPFCEIVMEKDYIRHAKPNGYRSYHMILKLQNAFYAEVQLRTISMDTWAALEHHMHYKKQVGGNKELIAAELKRCADELASTDVSMQTIRDMILEEQS
ncbi:MAG: GTP pyrophosphokinase family protein [Blautia sp.]|nr:GTP pyrophosphokinase family protein [Blautia sp.]